MRAEQIPVEVLLRLLAYDRETGGLTWRVRAESEFVSARYPARAAASWNKRHAGKPAFTCRVKGYLVGAIKRVSVKAHRVAWAIQTGAWPAAEIDHINGVRDDNRISNLRCVEQRENAKNRRLRADNRSGINGVHSEGRLWRANISVGGKLKNLGRFKTLDAAAAARAAAETLHGFHTNHGKPPPSLTTRGKLHD